MKKKSNAKDDDVQEIQIEINSPDYEEGMVEFIPKPTEQNSEFNDVSQKLNSILENADLALVENATNEIIKVSTESLSGENAIVSSNIFGESGPSKPIFHPSRDGEALMNRSEFNQLKISLIENGQIDDVEILNGKIVHGRNVALACFELGMTYRTIEYQGSEEDIPDYIKMKNLDRQQFSQIDKACFAAKKVDGVKADTKEILRNKISEIRNGKKPSLASPVHTYKFLSDWYGTGITAIKQVYRLLKKRPDLFAKVQAHSLSLPEAMIEVWPKTSKPQMSSLKISETTASIIIELAKTENMSEDELLRKLIDFYLNKKR
jgi:hypothetical protein